MRDLAYIIAGTFVGCIAAKPIGRPLGNAIGAALVWCYRRRRK